MTSLTHITNHVQMLCIYVRETMKKVLVIGEDVGMSCIKVAEHVRDGRDRQKVGMSRPCRKNVTILTLIYV